MEEMLNNEQVGQEVQPTATEQPFRTLVFKTQEEFDNYHASLIRKGEAKGEKKANSEINRKDLEAQIRAEIKREAEMSEAERLANERAKMEASFREERISINKDLARAKLLKAGFEEEEMEVHLEGVTEDRDVSLGRIERICEGRKSMQEKLLSKWQTELQTANPNVNIGGNQTVTAEQAKNMSIKERTELKRSNPALYDSLFKS